MMLLSCTILSSPRRPRYSSALLRASPVAADPSEALRSLTNAPADGVDSLPFTQAALEVFVERMHLTDFLDLGQEAREFAVFELLPVLLHHQLLQNSARRRAQVGDHVIGHDGKLGRPAN